ATWWCRALRWMRRPRSGSWLRSSSAQLATSASDRWPSMASRRSTSARAAGSSRASARRATRRWPSGPQAWAAAGQTRARTRARTANGVVGRMARTVAPAVRRRDPGRRHAASGAAAVPAPRTKAPTPAGVGADRRGRRSELPDPGQAVHQRIEVGLADIHAVDLHRGLDIGPAGVDAQRAALADGDV